MRRSIFIFLFFVGFSGLLVAQTNCSVNAGATESYCEGDKIKLRGAISGQFDLNTVRWQLVSAPAGANVIIEDPSSINTQTNNLTIPGEYQFQISMDCEIGSANQTVTHQLNAQAKGRLIFPDLICYNTTDPFWVQKEKEIGNAFIYDFEADNVFFIIQQEPDSILMVIRGCVDEAFYYPRYRVTNSEACPITMQDTVQTTLIYPAEISYIPPEVDDCGNLFGYCPSIGTPLWEITAPQNTNAFILDPNAQNTELCDYTDGEPLTISYSVTGLGCDPEPAQIEVEPDEPSCMEGDTISLGLSENKFCPGLMPNTILLEGTRIPNDWETIDWIQVFGPDTEMIGINSMDLTVSGLESDALYGFLQIMTDTISGCVRTRAYLIYEEDIDPDIEFFVRDESFGFCSTVISCNNQYIFQDNNPNQYFDIDMQVELLSYPPTLDLTEPFFLEFLTTNTGTIPLVFWDQQRINNFNFERLNLSEIDNGFLAMYLCSELVSGFYSFRVTLSNDCFEYEEEIVLSTISEFNTILPNAGTDQVLPCMQYQTTVVGNELGWDDLIVNGFWTAIEFPPGSDNPVPNLIQDQFLELDNLVVGKYVFRYYYSYNDLSTNQNICDYENRFDDVIVIVSDVEIIEIDQVPDQVFCLEDEYCITLPIDDGGSSTTLIQSSGPNITIPIIETGGLVCFQELEGGSEYGFEYVVDNGCSEYSQTFDLEITNSSISAANIFNQDTCVTGLIGDVHILSAQNIQDGIGEWTYIGAGEASFDPSPFDPNVTVTITNGLSFPVYREFIWTVTNTECESINEDNYVIKNTGYVPIDVANLIIDCNAEFPYIVDIEPSPAPEGVSVTWELLSSSSSLPPTIQDFSNDTTSIVIEADGTFIFELKYEFGGDCGELEEIAQIEVRLSTSDVVAYAGEDIIECQPNFQLNAVDPETNEGFWAIEDSSPSGLTIEIENAQDFNTNVTLLEQGTATLSWNILADDPSCGVVAQDDIQISWQEFDLISEDSAVCNETTVIIEHSPVFDSNIEWSLVSGPSDDFFVGALNPTSTLFSNLMEGVYIFEYDYDVGNSNCNSSGSIQIGVLGSGILESIQSFCEIDGNEIDNISLDFNIPELIIDNISIIDIPNGAATNVEASINDDNKSFNYDGFDVPGIYNFQFMGSSLSCEVNATIQIEIGGAPVIAPINFDPFCQGDEININLGVDDDLFVMWMPANLFDNPNNSNTNFIGEQSTTVSYIVSSSENFDECSTQGDIDIIINNLEATITNPQVLCEIEDVLIEIQSDDENLEVIWSNDNGENLGEGYSVLLSPEEDLQLLAMISDQAGCQLELSTTIELSPLVDGITADAEPSLIDLGASTQLSVTVNSGPLDNCNIEWTPTENLDNPNVQNPIATPVETTTYTVLIEKDGCESREDINVEVDNSCLLKEYYIPNMFTPNGDGHNDCFQVYGDMEDFELYIYDRWGEEIILITETNECWDGSYKSQALPPDVYAYYVKHIRCDGEELEFRGNVSLIK